MNARGFALIGIVIAAALVLILCFTLMKSYVAQSTPLLSPAADVREAAPGAADGRKTVSPVKPIAAAQNAKNAIESIEARRYEELERLAE